MTVISGRLGNSEKLAMLMHRAGRCPSDIICNTKKTRRNRHLGEEFHVSQLGAALRERMKPF